MGHGAGQKRQYAVQTILFPIGSLSALSVSLALDSSPEGGAKGVYKSAQPAHQTSVIPPKGTRRQSRRRERAKPDVGIRSPYAALILCTLPRDADCRVARPSLLAMTGQFSLARRFRQNREALPLLGEVPSAHTGERGRRSRTRCRREKTGRTPPILFSIGSFSAMATPQALRASSPKRGAKGVD